MRLAHIPLDQRRDLARGEDAVREAGGDQRLRHPGELGGIGVLRDAQAAGGLDRLGARGAVGAGAGEHDGDGAVAERHRERAEEVVDGMSEAAALHGLAEMQPAIGEGERATGPDHVHVTGQHAHAVDDLLHRHGRVPGEDFGHQAGVVGRQVLDHDVRDPRPVGGTGEEVDQGRDTACGGADADDRKGDRRIRRRPTRGGIGDAFGIPRVEGWPRGSLRVGGDDALSFEFYGKSAAPIRGSFPEILRRANPVRVTADGATGYSTFTPMRFTIAP